MELLKLYLQNIECRTYQIFTYGTLNYYIFYDGDMNVIKMIRVDKFGKDIETLKLPQKAKFSLEFHRNCIGQDWQ